MEWHGLVSPILNYACLAGFVFIACHERWEFDVVRRLMEALVAIMFLDSHIQ